MMMSLVALAVGQAHVGYYPPLIVQGQMNFEGDLVWNAVNNIPNLPLNGIFNNTACSKKSCIAVGLNVVEIIPSIILQPSLAQKQINGKDNWSVIDLKNLPARGKFEHASCADDFCMAFGPNLASGGSVLATQNSTNQNEWNFVTLNLPSNVSIEGISCFQDVCFAVGGDPMIYNGKAGPVILSSRDKGNSWQMISVSNLPKTGAFLSASCSKNMCIAAGQDTTSNVYKPPILAQSSDQGKSWQMVDIPNSPQNGFFYRTSCSENRCIAVGSVGVYEHPLLAESNDAGKSWSIPNIADLPQNAFFTNAHCTDQFCIAVGGQGNVGDTPLIVQSNNNEPWSTIHIQNLPMHLRLFSVSCSETICIASGGSPYMQAEEPAGLLQSFDHGKSWNLVHIKNMPELGTFNGNVNLK
jgi:hypothetical protein